MDCKQCGADNDERAIECGYCGAQVRRPYAGDPLGKWLSDLNADFFQRHCYHWLETSIIVAAPTIALIGFVVAYFVLAWGMGWAIFFGISLLCMNIGVATLFEYPLMVRRRRKAFEQENGPRIEKLCHGNGIKGWRLYVVAGETFTAKGFVRGYLYIVRVPEDT